VASRNGRLGNFVAVGSGMWGRGGGRGLRPVWRMISGGCVDDVLFGWRKRWRGFETIGLCR
jgi:hypothetical protein